MAKAPILIAANLPTDKQAAFYADCDRLFLADEAKVAADAAYRAAAIDFAEKWAKGLPEGTETMELGFGKQLKVESRINRTIDRAALALALDYIKTPAAPGTNAAGLKAELKGAIDACISYKPDLSDSNFKKLDDDARKLLADIITEKPGSVGLKFHQPKA